MFSNAKSVEINGKEVKSIILENGAILYEKEYPYVLSVSSDKDILSYADQDSATLTASLTKGGVPVEGEEVIFHTNKPIKGPVIYSSGDIITLSEGEEILIPKNAQFNIDTGTNGSGDYFHWNNGDFEYGNINGDIVITSSSLGRTVTVPKVSGTINTISSITIKKINGEYIVEDSNSDLVVEYSPNYDNGTLTTNLEIELGGEIDTISLITNNNGIVTYQYNSQGIGDITFDISCMNLQETYGIEDCHYYSTTEYKRNTDYITLDISLPSTFKLEYDIKPTSRSTSGWGSGCYLRLGATSNSGVWAGQLTSAGKHGLMPKPSGTTQYCTTNTVLNTDNHITVVYDGTTVTYTCNGESVSLSASNLTKINGVVPTANNGLKNIKIKPL